MTSHRSDTATASFGIEEASIHGPWVFFWLNSPRPRPRPAQAKS